MKSKLLIENAINRQRNFFESEEPGVLLFLQDAESEQNWDEIMSLDDFDWQNSASIKAYADRYLNGVKSMWELSENIDDDYIPSIQVLCGTGAIGGSFVKDANVKNDGITNYLKPFIDDDYNGLDRIGFDPENPFYKGHMTILRTFIERGQGAFGICPFSHFDPLDLANQFRGNDFFMDIMDEDKTEVLHELLARCTQSILDLEAYTRSQFMNDFEFNQNVCLGFLLSGGTYLSCDAGDMMGPESLQHLGLPYIRQILENWGGAFVHHHELGIHQIPTWSKVDDLNIQFLNRDPNTRHLATTLDDSIIESSLEKPISFIAEAEECKKHLQEWNNGRFVVYVRCENKKEAENIMELKG